MMKLRLSQLLLLFTSILMTGCVLDAILFGDTHKKDWGPLITDIEEEKGRLILDGYPLVYIKGYEEGWREGKLERPAICASPGGCVRAIEYDKTLFPLFVCPSDRAHAFTGKKDLSAELWVHSPSHLLAPMCMINDGTSYQEGWLAGRMQRGKLNSYLAYLHQYMQMIAATNDELLRQSALHDSLTLPGILDMR
ncbi:MAG TPA: hypothetical protein PKD12_02615 [Nitrospira sp.]|nr:hypothetical protein [Nitrospira sp.]